MTAPDDLDLNEVDRLILAELAKGRCNPVFLIDRLDKSEQHIHNRLSRLLEHGLISRPATGLYEITDAGKERL